MRKYRRDGGNLLKSCQIELLDKIYVFGGIKMDTAATSKKKKFKN